MSKINIEVNDYILNDAMKILEKEGCTLNQVIDNLLYYSVIQNRIAIAYPKPSRKLRKALKEAQKMEKHPEKYVSYDNVHQMFEEIINGEADKKQRKLLKEYYYNKLFHRK